VIVYQSTQSQFLKDSEENAIEDIVAESFHKKVGRSVPEAEFRAWRHSLMQMMGVLADDDLPDNMGVGIEFGIPYSNKCKRSSHPSHKYAKQLVAKAVKINTRL